MLPLLCSLAGHVAGLKWYGKCSLAPDVLSFGHGLEPAKIKTDSTADSVMKTKLLDTGTVAGES